MLLGIDLGDRRIGIAAGDTGSGSVKPLLTLRRGTPAQDAKAIARIVRERRVEGLVVGLPLHEDGRESEQSRLTRAWVERLARRAAVVRREAWPSAPAGAACAVPDR